MTDLESTADLLPKYKRVFVLFFEFRVSQINSCLRKVDLFNMCDFAFCTTITQITKM